MAPGDTPIRRRQGSKHDKTGCLTCRYRYGRECPRTSKSPLTQYRHKKCLQNTFPVCGTCARLNIECIREPPRKVLPSNLRKSSENESSTTMSVPPAVAPNTALHAAMSASTLRRHAINYYMAVLANHATVSEQYNSFLSAFLPMAMESKALTEALSSWALGHMAFGDPSYEMIALRSRSAALRELSSALDAPGHDLSSQETNAAASLLMTISEVCQGDRHAWYRHLEGTKSIIVNTAQGALSGADALRQSSEGQWILRNFAYHDVLASVTLQRPPMLDAKYLDGITDLVDSCLGVATSILRDIAEIASLEADRSLDDFQQDLKLDVLEERLSAWQCPADTQPDLAAVAEAYRCAAQILLYRLRSRRSGQHQEWQTQVDAAVARLLDSISGIPLKSVAEGPLVFPLFIAGGEASMNSQREAVRQRLHASLDRRKFRNISLAIDVLEKLWAEQTKFNSHDGKLQPTWRDILNASEGRLSLT